MRILPVSTLLCCALFLNSCRRHEPAPASAIDAFAGPDATTVVAKVNGAPIALETFQRALLRGNSRMTREAALEELIRHETLVAQAKAGGYDRDPEILAAFERMLASRFQEKELARRAQQSIPVSDADIEAAYQRDAQKYTTAASVRAGVIFLAANLKATPDKRAETQQRAKGVWERVREADAAGFSQLAQQHSEDQATRYRSGDSGWLKWNDSESRWEPEIVEAAFRLKTVGEVAPLILTSRGFYIVRLSETRPATVRPLGEVKDGIRYQLAQARQQRQQIEFLEELRRNSRVEINQSLVDSIPEPTNRAARQPPPLPGG